MRKAPSKYGRAFLYTESDENDVTYFALYHLGGLERAVGSLHEYVAEKVQQIRRAQVLIRNSGQFNHRQIALLGHAMRDPGHSYTVTPHARSHNVSAPTARQDLSRLVEMDLLDPVPSGRTTIYYAVPDLERRLGNLGRPRPKRRTSRAARD
jgi:Fic family protein